MKFYINSFTVLGKQPERLPKWKMFILWLIKVKPHFRASFTLVCHVNGCFPLNIGECILAKDSSQWRITSCSYSEITIASFDYLEEFPNICGEAVVISSSANE